MAALIKYKLQKCNKNHSYKETKVLQRLFLSRTIFINVPLLCHPKLGLHVFSTLPCVSPRLAARGAQKLPLLSFKIN